MDASALPRHPAYVRRSRAALRLASDKRLVELVRAGEAIGFEVLYDRHARKLLSFCRHMLGSLQDGEDALQRTFASAYRALLVDEREIELRPWLFAIARNECVSILRQRRPTGELDDAEPATDGLSSRVQGREDLRDLLADLRALPERQRAALLLSELGGFTHAQIAEAIGARPEQIRAYVFQARSNLIAERDARERSCVEVRAKLTSSRGAALLQRGLSRHLRRCRGCRDYSDALRHQRRALAIVLPVAPSLALRSAVLRAALGSGHGAGAGAGITGAGLAATNTGGKALLAKGLAAITLAGVTAGAGTLALHATSNHNPRARAPRSAKASFPHRNPVSSLHLVGLPRPQRSPTLRSQALRRVATRASRSEAPPPGTSGRGVGRDTRASIPTRTGPALPSAPAARGQVSASGALPQPALTPSRVGASQREPASGSNARGVQRGAANGGAAKQRVSGRVRSKSGSPSESSRAHLVNASSQAPGAAASVAATESGDPTPPGHAYGQEPSKSTPPGHATDTGSGGGPAPGNSASAPGHTR